MVDGYSEEFESNFLELLRQAHGSSRVSAKVVYNEFINDRNHVHMNSTQWLTLTEFVKYLGKEGKCRVDETPKGWFISLIQKDPMEQLSDDRRLKRSRAEKVLPAALHLLVYPVDLKPQAPSSAGGSASHFSALD